MRNPLSISVASFDLMKALPQLVGGGNEIGHESGIVINNLPYTSKSNKSGHFTFQQCEWLVIGPLGLPNITNNKQINI